MQDNYDKSIRVRMHSLKVADLKWAAHQHEKTYAEFIRTLVEQEVERLRASTSPVS